MSSPAPSSSSLSLSSSSSRSRLFLGGVAAVAALAGVYFLFQKRRSACSKSSQEIDDARRAYTQQQQSGPIISDATRSLFQRWEALLERATPVTIDDSIITERFWRVYHTALESHPYKCIHQKRFLEARLCQHSFYKTLIGQSSSEIEQLTFSRALTSKPVAERRLLDVGCCFGTDMRQLVLEGFRPSNLLGLDINDTFISLGLDILFDDRNGPLGQRFVTGDILDDTTVERTPKLKEFVDSGIDAIYAGSVYHLLSEDNTRRLSEAIFRMVASGGCAFGRTVGVVGDQIFGHKIDKPAVGGHDLRYLHSAGSLTEQLKQVGFTNIHVEIGEIDMVKMRSGRDDTATTQMNGQRKEVDIAMLTFYAEKP